MDCIPSQRSSLYVHLFPHNSNYDIRDKLVAFFALGLVIAIALNYPVASTLLSVTLVLRQRLTNDVNRYEGVSQLYVQ